MAEHARDRIDERLTGGQVDDPEGRAGEDAVDGPLRQGLRCLAGQETAPSRKRTQPDEASSSVRLPNGSARFTFA